MRARGPPVDADDSIAAHLMRITDPNTGQLLSDEALLPQVSVLFWAGFDTTGNTMAWTLYCISQHPEVGCPTAKCVQAPTLKGSNSSIEALLLAETLLSWQCMHTSRCCFLDMFHTC